MHAPTGFCISPKGSCNIQVFKRFNFIEQVNLLIALPGFINPSVLVGWSCELTWGKGRISISPAPAWGLAQERCPVKIKWMSSCYILEIWRAFAYSYS